MVKKMKDEEKAEEILQTKGSMTFCAKGCGYTEKVKELIAIGLAEGRKENAEKISVLEKENAKLKQQIEQGMKQVCEICEQHMLEEHPNACGCAFRRLGNEYCWECK